MFATPYSLRFDPTRLTGAIDWHGHLGFAAWLMENMRPRSVVELGVFRGDSLAAFSQAAREQGVDCTITGVDTWQGDTTTGEYNDVFPELKDYFDVHHPATKLMRRLFDEARDDFADGSIDLLHIDGCHHYEAVKHDYESWKPKMSSRGVILFHDTEAVAPGFGTHRFWQEIKGEYPSFGFLHSNGLGVLLVGPDQPEALKQLAASPEAADAFRAAYEAQGAKFFYLAKMKYWQSELQRLAASISQPMPAVPAVPVGGVKALISRLMNRR